MRQMWPLHSLTFIAQIRASAMRLALLDLIQVCRSRARGILFCVLFGPADG